MRRAGTLLAATGAVALAWVVITGRPSGAAGAGLLALVTAAGLVLRHRAGPAEPHRLGGLVLLLALLPTVVHLHADGGRLGGDGVSYYVYVRSLAKDADLDFTNEYTHYGLIERSDIAVPTRTGRRRSIFAVGPGLVWLPFFATGEALARLDALSGRAVDLSGYGPHHVNAVALGSTLLGFAAVWLIRRVLARHFAAPVATGAALLVWFATFLYWYMVQHPAMSHAASTFGAAAVVALWDAQRGRRSPRGYAALGLALGFAMCLRWQNAMLVLLPAFELGARAWRARRAAPTVRDEWARAVRDGGCLLAALVVGALPQMAAWRVIYGEWLLADPPHGADFLRLARPFVLETLFSSRHGLLSWTPVLWIALLGFVPLWRDRRSLALPLLAPLLLMTYVNMCSGDWWAGGSFSNRRFDSLLPVLAFGLAAGLESLRAAVARRPSAALAVLVIASSLWSALGVAQARQGDLDPFAPPGFARLVGQGARRVAAALGSPPTWPASWIFAVSHGRPAAQYDALVGRYLFYRQNNLQGRMAVGDGDGALLGEGWGPASDFAGRPARSVHGRARVLAPLDEPEDLVLTLHAAAHHPTPVQVEVEVNGGHVGGFLVAGPAWAAHTVAVPAAAWRRDLNDVVLVSAGLVWVESIAASRAGAHPGQESGFRAR